MSLEGESKIGRVYFEDRCKLDPQGVIQDLLGQIRRQAKDIREKQATIDRLMTHWRADRRQLAEIREADPSSTTGSIPAAVTPPWEDQGC
jgi:hypothetical protein